MAEQIKPEEAALRELQRLLVPLDGSPMSEAVAPSVARLAQKAGAQITLLHLIERHAPAVIHGTHHISSEHEAEEYLHQVAEKYFEGQKVSWHVHTEGIDNVGRGLSSHAEEFEPDLIVMCYHDHAGWWHWFWGSLGQQVVREAMPPVLLFRYVDSLSPEFPFGRVLVPLDGDPRHETGIHAGSLLARLSGAPVELLQVVPTVGTLTGPRGITRSYLPGATAAILDVAEEQTRRYLASQLERLTNQGLTADASIARGDPFEEIKAYIDRVRPDLLVLGTHGKIGTEAFWAGSITQRLVNTCRLTFLLAPAKES